MLRLEGWSIAYEAVGVVRQTKKERGVGRKHRKRGSGRRRWWISVNVWEKKMLSMRDKGLFVGVLNDA